MSFDNKQYPNRKDKRKPYYKKAQNVSIRCRCNGGCSYCLSNRMHKNKKRMATDDDGE